jgi:6-hydroxynicotinate 3-monooxygenase
MARPLSIAMSAAAWAGLQPPRRVGIAVTVYEQATQFARLGAGIQIGCNAMKALRKLGLEARLRGGSSFRAPGTTATGRPATSTCGSYVSILAT